MIGEAIAGAVQGFGNVGIGIWNAYQQSRNYEYQKQLQKQIFEREDNALQRRVADAEKAGYNKFAVLGQGAGAGSVVSTTAPQVDENLGSRFADAMQHTYQLAVERNSAKIAEANAEKAQAEKQITFNAEKVSNWQTALNIAQMMKDAGYAPQFHIDDYNKLSVGRFYEDGATGSSNPYAGRFFEDTPVGQYWQNDYGNAKAQAEIQKTDAEWRKTNYVVGILSKILGGVNSGINATSSWRKRY